MNQTAAESTGIRSLSETHTDGLQFFVPEQASVGRGCLLQIYPAAVHADMTRLTKRRTLIGRDLSCDVALEDTAVSRTHAAIDCDDNGYHAVDLGSRNGTFVDDQLLRDRLRLNGGELIRTGSTVLKFMASMDEEAQYHAVVHQLMTRDPLTNAFNRSYLMSSLEKLLPRCRRCGGQLSVILIDIDHFKKVNDTHGHLAGDEVLRIFSERLRSELQSNHLLCRLGGEEFVVIVEDTGLRDALRTAEQLRLAVASAAFLTHAGPLRITCSLGVATFDPAAATTTVDQLLSQADGWLYAAKKAGRNCVQSARNLNGPVQPV
jgi:diguanylate cyclase (GGDEF)-like protein